MMVLASSAVAQGAASEDPCLYTSEPWVAVSFSGPAFSPELERAVLLDLRAGLRLKGIEACAATQAGHKPPLAMLELTASSPERLSVSIEVHDAITQKRVQRDVDLTGVAPDARSLTIAAATDELLRASWVELALADAPQSDRPAPPEVHAAVRDTIEPARIGQRDLALGARGRAEYFSAGLAWLGGDLIASAWLAEHAGVELAMGARAGLPRHGEHGELHASALVGSLSLRLALSERRAPLGVEALTGLAVASVRMRGQAEDGAADFSGSGIDVHALGSLLFRVSVAPWLDLRLDVGAGAPLAFVEATDAGSVVASTSGIQLHAGLGAELKL